MIFPQLKTITKCEVSRTLFSCATKTILSWFWSRIQATVAPTQGVVNPEDFFFLSLCKLYFDFTLKRTVWTLTTPLQSTHSLIHFAEISKLLSNILPWHLSNQLYKVSSRHWFMLDVHKNTHINKADCLSYHRNYLMTEAPWCTFTCTQRKSIYQLNHPPAVKSFI